MRRKFAVYLGVLRLHGAGTPNVSLFCPQDMSKYLEKTRNKTIGDCSVNYKSLASLLECDCCS